MSKKISIEQIASWRSGEMITEQKLNDIFALIGKVINLQADDIDLLVKNLNELHLAYRWIGIVDKFNDIETLINNNKDKPEYQPPNNPLPTSGDVVIVNNNSDDSNLPPSINPGRYMYIYISELDGKNGRWELYNPFTILNASKYNDGLMSKEDKNKLDNLPDGQELQFKLDRFDEEISLHQNIITKNKFQIELNKNNIENLKPRVDKLEQNKQDKITDLPNYKTKTVEDNLVEVKTIVDNIDLGNLIIWENQGNGDKDGITTINNYRGDVVVIKIKDNIKYEDLIVGTSIKFNITFQNSILNVITEVKPKGNLSHFAGATSKNDTLIHYYGNFFWDSEIGITIALTFIDLPQDGSYTFTCSKILKDIGISDYAWSEILNNKINTMLNKTLGIRKQLIYANNRLDGFNGFRAGDEFKLSFNYLNGMNSIELYLGGIKLTKGVEWEEIGNINIDSISDKIRFLQDINIDKEGAIDIIALTIVTNTFTFGIWDATTKWNKGSLVIDDGKIYYAKQDNINVKPSLDVSQEYWIEFKTDIDIDAIKKELELYIDQVANSRVDAIVDNKVNEAVDNKFDTSPSTNRVIEYKGQIIPFEDEEEYEIFKDVSQTDDTYFEDYIPNKDDKKDLIIDVNFMLSKSAFSDDGTYYTYKEQRDIISDIINKYINNDFVLKDIYWKVIINNSEGISSNGINYYFTKASVQDESNYKFDFKINWTNKQDSKKINCDMKFKKSYLNISNSNNNVKVCLLFDFYRL